MNQTIASSRVSSLNVPKASIQVRGHASLLAKITSRLVEAVKGFNLNGPVNKNHRSYTDENLLNPVVGHEISRTLRR